MYCSKCGAEIDENTEFCAACGAPVGESDTSQNTTQYYYQQTPPAYQQKGAKNNIVAGLLGIFLGSLGIHKFYLGYSKPGLIMLLVSLLTFGIGAFVMEIIGLIEGIIYLTKSEEEFYNIYEANQKEWF